MLLWFIFISVVLWTYPGEVSGMIECGKVRSMRIVGGKTANASTVAWLVALVDAMYADSYKKPVTCGGTRITPNIVLTAAHCFIDVENPQEKYVVVFGMQDSCNAPKAVVRRIQAVVPHENFSEVEMRHDIALIRLLSPAPSSFVSCCLPGPGYKYPRATKLVIAGFGSMKEGGDGACQLQKGHIDLIPRNVCSTTEIWTQVRDSPEIICAGKLDGGSDTCQGDSGGPLMDVGSTFVWCIGVVSFGMGCARANSPGAYTNVSMYSGWLLTTIAKMTGSKIATLTNVKKT